MTKRPLLGCGAAVWNDCGELLLIKRLKEPDAGCWGLPGGKIDWGESARECIVREVEEELGILISEPIPVCMTETIDGGDGQHWVAPIFSTDRFVGTAHLMEPGKHEAFKWSKLDDLPSPLTQPFQQFLLHLGTLTNHS